jgi:hypothetical protein
MLCEFPLSLGKKETSARASQVRREVLLKLPYLRKNFGAQPRRYLFFACIIVIIIIDTKVVPSQHKLRIKHFATKRYSTENTRCLVMAM